MSSVPAGFLQLSKDELSDIRRCRSKLLHPKLEGIYRSSSPDRMIETTGRGFPIAMPKKALLPNGAYFFW